jgi:hypothetical protein
MFFHFLSGSYFPIQIWHLRRAAAGCLLALFVPGDFSRRVTFPAG